MLKSLIVIAALIPTTALAADPGFYVQGSVGSPLDNLKRTNHPAGASGPIYGSATPFGIIGDVDTEAKTSYSFAGGYRVSDRIRFDIGYYRFDYGATRWGVDFVSRNGTYNPAFATPFTGALSSEAYIASVYFSKPVRNKLSGFIGLGAGPSSNLFAEASESNYATVHKRLKHDFALKVELGGVYEVDPKTEVQLGVSAIRPGRFSSANRRTILGPQEETIAPYRFVGEFAPVVDLTVRRTF